MRSRRRPPARRPHRLRTFLSTVVVLAVAVSAVALVRTGHIGQSQDLATARADGLTPADTTVDPGAASKDTAGTATDASVASADSVEDMAAAPRDPGATGTSPDAEPVAATVRQEVYFPTADLSGLRATGVEVSAVAPLGGALAALGRGVPGGADALPIIGALQSVTRRGSTAILDFDAGFISGYPAGSAAEVALLAPLVYTATAVAGIDRVLITVDGATPEAPGSFDLAEPLARTGFPGLGE